MYAQIKYANDFELGLILTRESPIESGYPELYINALTTSITYIDRPRRGYNYVVKKIMSSADGQ